MKIKEYDIITALTLEQLITLVEYHINKYNFQPIGNHIQNNHNHYQQTMVKYEDSISR